MTLIIHCSVSLMSKLLMNPIQIASDTTKVLIVSNDKSLFPELLPTVVPALVSIIVVLFTLWFSKKAIDKTAEANRVSNMHFQLYKCSSDTLRPVSQMIVLIENVAYGIVHTENGEVIETAYERYTKEIDKLSKEYNLLITEHELILPEEIIGELRTLINKINSGIRVANLMNPSGREQPIDVELFNENKNELQPLVKEIIKLYEELVNEIRGYLGIQRLKPIGSLSNLKLVSTEDTTNTESFN